jgi:tetratricopeptide (TPR) repeat protein
MSETRKLAAILAADVVGYSRLVGAHEERTLARLRGLRSDLIDPAIAAQLTYAGRVGAGMSEKVLKDLRRRLDPLARPKSPLDAPPPRSTRFGSPWMTNAGLAKNHIGNWEQAVAWFRRSIEANRNYPPTYFNLAAALAQLGRLDEAHSAVRAGLALNPAYNVARRLAFWTAMSDNPRYLAQLEPIFQGMRKAGVPDE